MQKVLALLLLACAASSAAEPRHVVIVVWDGMRPDLVRPEIAPALSKLAQEGVTFRNHHSVFPSATNVNGTAIVTGAYPGHNGILANHVYRPELEPMKSVDVEAPAIVEKGDQWSAGHYVAVPTLPEMVQDAGLTSVVATAKTVGLLLDRHIDPDRYKKSVTLFAGVSLPGNMGGGLVKAFGPFPPSGNAAARDIWTTRALTDFFWRDQVPAFSLLWLGEPDDTEHKTTPGAPPALAAIKGSDNILAHVIDSLDRRKLRSTTDILVVSDHGFSTIARMIDLPKQLKDRGFDVVTEYADRPKPGQIMMVGNGGCVLFYVAEQDRNATQRLVDFLEQSDFAGVILTKEALAGTFKLSVAKTASDTAPDVVMAFRWYDRPNEFGLPGLIDADWQRAAGHGTHATFSRYDMHNMLIAAGPDFGHGVASDLPSGNVDLAPTTAKILGIGAPPMDGRVLSEASARPEAPPVKVEADTIEATKDFPTGRWHQYLKISHVGSTFYLDEGNGEFAPANH